MKQLDLETILYGFELIVVPKIKKEYEVAESNKKVPIKDATVNDERIAENAQPIGE